LVTNPDRENVIKIIAYFLNHEDGYNEKNKPYKEGIILYGEPGCGKSFFIMQLASMFDLNVYYMNLNNFTSESHFLKAILSINHPSILLIEDIDCVTNLEPRDSKEKGNLESRKKGRKRNK
jgi:chaperone BCS1